MNKKIFDLAKMQTTDAATVFVCAPKIEELESNSLAAWIEHLGKQVSSATNEEVALKYEQCSRLLLLAAQTAEDAELWAAYNVPCITGNEIMFVIKFSSKRDTDNFIWKLEDLEAEFSK